MVDDEASILAITSQTLQAFGYRVLTATDGADAVAVYAQHQDEIAVVLTDMMMPVMDGAATIHALMRINPTIKIVAASGLNANGGRPKRPEPASNISSPNPTLREPCSKPSAQFWTNPDGQVERIERIYFGVTVAGERKRMNRVNGEYGKGSALQLSVITLKSVITILQNEQTVVGVLCH